VLRGAGRWRELVGYAFLSDEWFSEVDKIRAEIGDLGLPAAVRNIRINVEVSGAPSGVVQANFGADGITKGLVAQAPTKIKLPYATLRRILIDRDASAGMEAFMSGQLQIEGDPTQLMSLQSSAGSTSEAALKLMKRVLEITQ